MMKLFLASAWVAPALAVLPFVPAPPPLRIEGIDRLADNSGSFEQLVDHENAASGTFQQRFWWNATFWAGPGSPVSRSRPRPTPVLTGP
jgi:hypothetical protein